MVICIKANTPVHKFELYWYGNFWKPYICHRKILDKINLLYFFLLAGNFSSEEVTRKILHNLIFFVNDASQSNAHLMNISNPVVDKNKDLLDKLLLIYKIVVRLPLLLLKMAISAAHLHFSWRVETAASCN